MRVINTLVLAATVVAFTAPALACGGMQSKQSAQTTTTKTGPQTVVKQTASQPGK